MRENQTTSVLDLAVEVARFYGGLRAGGVPETAAATIAGQYMTTTMHMRLMVDRGMFPKSGEPWEDS